MIANENKQPQRIECGFKQLYPSVRPWTMRNLTFYSGYKAGYKWPDMKIWNNWENYNGLIYNNTNQLIGYLFFQQIYIKNSQIVDILINDGL